MEQKQADAIAQAILDPDRRQEALLRKREQEEKSIAQRRNVAWFTLAGCGIGALAAAFTNIHFGTGVLYGGLAGSALGWLVAVSRGRKSP